MVLNDNIRRYCTKSIHLRNYHKLYFFCTGEVFFRFYINYFLQTANIQWSYCDFCPMTNDHWLKYFVLSSMSQNCNKTYKVQSTSSGKLEYLFTWNINSKEEIVYGNKMPVLVALCIAILFLGLDWNIKTLQWMN